METNGSAPARMSSLFALSWVPRTEDLRKPIRASALSTGSCNLSAARISMMHCATAMPLLRKLRRISEFGHSAEWLMQGAGAPSSALDSYRHALGLDPAYLPALEGAAQIEYQQRSAAAKPLILRVLAQLPNDPTSHTMLAFLEYAAKDCADAIPHFEKGGEVLAKQPIALAAYGACLAQAGQYHQAIPLFQQALSAEPSVESIRFNLALAQWKANQPQEALLTLQPAIEVGNGQSDALLLAADIYESTNDTQHAVELLRKAILSDPKNVDAYLDFANLSYDHASMQVGIDILNAGIRSCRTKPASILFAESFIRNSGNSTKLRRISGWRTASIQNSQCLARYRDWRHRSNTNPSKLSPHFARRPRPNQKML